MSSYCQLAPGHPLHGPYHDCHYGFPVSEESALFERLVLEINQAGLSWLTILAKQENFRRAYDLVLMAVALLVLPASNVAYSVIGAILIGVVLGFNHRPGRYQGRC